jgi:hypothetical protein
MGEGRRYLEAIGNCFWIQSWYRWHLLHYIRVYDQWAMDFPIVLIGMRRFGTVACYRGSWWHAEMAHHPMRWDVHWSTIFILNLHPVDAMAGHHMLHETYSVMCECHNYANKDHRVGGRLVWLMSCYGGSTTSNSKRLSGGT